MLAEANRYYGWVGPRIAFVALLAACGRAGFASTDASPRDGAADSVDGPPITANLVFASTTPVAPGALAGAAGADALCNQYAGLAGLPGHYVAWISTTAANAIDRLGNARGWVRIDGLPIADLATDLANGLPYAIILDVHGAYLPSDHTVATATDPAGHLLPGNCADFTDTADATPIAIGFADATDASFTYSGAIPCSTAARIYCFGTDLAAPVVVAPLTGRLAFVTQATWTPGSGFASADAACAGEATAAALPGTYLAMLASKTASTASRFSLAGPSWVRVDGVRLAATPAALFAAKLDAPLSLTAAGARVPPSLVWTGYQFSSDDGNAIGSETCNDWSVSSSGAFGGRGSSARASRDLWTNGQPASCDSAARLFCLQE